VSSVRLNGRNLTALLAIAVGVALYWAGRELVVDGLVQLITSPIDEPEREPAPAAAERSSDVGDA